MIKLVPITRANWERAIALRLSEDQQQYLPDNLYSIAQSRFEQAELFGIYLEKLMIGFAMVCQFSGVYWITRFMIDIEQQGHGYGREALNALTQKILSKPGAHEIRTTVSMKNAAGEYLFHSLGFRRTGELEDREIVMKLEVNEMVDY